MFVKNFEEPPPGMDRFELSGQEKDGNYPLPNFFKYVAWFIVLLTVVSSSTVLIMYGTSFGMVKSYLWLTCLLLCIVLSTFVTAPLEIFIFALINTMCSKRKPVIAKRRINPCVLHNPDNPVKKERVLRFRQCNDKLYNPTSLHKLQTRLDNIRYNLELRNLLADMAFYYIFLMVGLYLVIITKTHMIFYTNKVIKENILNSSCANGLMFKDVVSYKTFLEYLNTTLLPTLLINPKDNPDNSSLRKRRSWDSDTWGDTTRPPDLLRKRQILYDFTKTAERKNVFNKGWTMNPNLKLMGKPRLRQIRVKSGYCKLYPHLKARSLECVDDLSLFNVESRNFHLGWESGPAKGLTDAQAAPWIYRSAWKSGTLPVFSKFSAYPGGGYVLDLARHIDDARIILEFLDVFNWVDTKTRAIFVEFTLYCANTNSFTVVTLIVEKPATGYFITSHRIHTRKFLFLARELEHFTLGISGLFCVIFFLFLLRETLKIHRISFKLYLKRALVVVDICLTVFGLLCIVFIILRSIYVSRLLKKLEKSANNKFISFIYADVWAAWTEYLEALLIGCAALKLFYLSRFRVVIFQFQKAVYRCLRCLSNLALKQIVIYIAFALFFNLTLVNYSEVFKTFGMSLSTLIEQSVTVDTFTLKIITGSSFLCSVFFVLFIFLMSFLFINMFIAVVCMYWASIQNVNFTDKYNLFEFIRYLLTIWKQNDILHMKEGKTPTGKWEDTVLRLRGGGRKCTEKKKKKKKCKKKCENREVEEEEEERKLYLREFMTKKLYDSTIYQCLNSGHSVALKNFMVMLLTEDEELREVFSEESLKALFYCYITDSTGDDGCMKGEPGNYFLTKGTKGTKVYDVRTFERMRKVVEDWAKEKDLIIEEEQAGETIGCDHLGILEEKLNLLERKLCSKFHEC